MGSSVLFFLFFCTQNSHKTLQISKDFPAFCKFRQCDKKFVFYLTISAGLMIIETAA